MKRTRQSSIPVSAKVHGWPGKFTVPIRRAGNSACRFQNGTVNCNGSAHEETESLVFPKRVFVSVWQVGSFEVTLGKSRLNHL
jgi:hypothetical protein